MNLRTILPRVLIGGLIGAVVSACVWAVALFSGTQYTAISLQFTGDSPNTFLLDATFDPSRYLLIFEAIGIFLGVAAGAALSARTIRFKQAQTVVSRPSGTDSWPPSPTPPVV